MRGKPTRKQQSIWSDPNNVQIHYFTLKIALTAYRLKFLVLMVVSYYNISHLILSLPLTQNSSLYAMLQLHPSPKQHPAHVSVLPTLPKILPPTCPLGHHLSIKDSAQGSHPHEVFDSLSLPSTPAPHLTDSNQSPGYI